MKTNKQFINQAKKIHGNKYKYTLTEYKDSYTKVKIICKIHGIFEIAPYCHTSLKQGCCQCGILLKAKKLTKTITEFIEQAKNIHGNKYNYSKVKYYKSKIPIIIVCPIHGKFKQTPTTHLGGSGCMKCGYLSNTVGVDKFITQAKNIHGNFYDYSKVLYTRIDRKVTIICPIHGSFNTTPLTHLNGSICPICARLKRTGGYSYKLFQQKPYLKTKEGSLYVVKLSFKKETFIKIGITTLKYPSHRLASHISPYNYKVLCTYTDNLYNLYILEQHILECLKLQAFTPKHNFKGWSECLHINTELKIQQLIKEHVV